MHMQHERNNDHSLPQSIENHDIDYFFLIVFLYTSSRRSENSLIVPHTITISM